MRRHLSRQPARFTLIEVAIAILIFAAAFAALLGVLGGARARTIRSQRKWARSHLLASAVEFHLLVGESDHLPEGILPEGFSAECTVEDLPELPLEAEEEIRGWKLAEYHIIVRDPMGEQVGGQVIRKMISEKW